jgi:acyl-CoA reductase-like NAD-dependent aldehyde dehydrogenase
MRLDMIIGGDDLPAADGQTFETVSPTTNEPIAVVPKASAEDVDRAVKAARKAFDEGPWSRFTPLERSRALNRVAGILRERVEEIARL